MIRAAVNPALRASTFRSATPVKAMGTERAFTVEHTINKTAFLLLLVVVCGGVVWSMTGTTPESMSRVQPIIMIGALGGLIAALVGVFKPHLCKFTAPLYACLKGSALGGISALANAAYPGVVGQAVSLTITVFFAMLILYRFKIIKVTERFRIGVAAAVGGIFLFYLFTWILNFAGMPAPIIHGSSGWSIAFSIFVVGVAALTLVVDFDFIERQADGGASAGLEWYAAQGLLVSLVWLYIEILRLLMKLRGR
ncbi:MAG: Bax inhibitor-1/YccA family protein [Opitutales bacterium]